MKLIEILSPDFTFADNRGTLTQICHKGYNQVNAVFTKKDAVRGRMHYHRENTETFFIIQGQCRVTVKYGDQTESYIFSSGDMFTIPKSVRHDFLYTQDTYLVGMYDGCVEKEDGKMDIYCDEE